MTNTVENKSYNLIGKIAMGMYNQNLDISLDALKQILNDNGADYSDQSNRGLGQSVSAAYRAWEKSDPVVHKAIQHTFKGRNGNFPWE